MLLAKLVPPTVCSKARPRLMKLATPLLDRIKCLTLQFSFRVQEARDHSTRVKQNTPTKLTFGNTFRVIYNRTETFLINKSTQKCTGSSRPVLPPIPVEVHVVKQSQSWNIQIWYHAQFEIQNRD